MARIINAEFIISAPSIKLALPDDMSEVAVMGRSNVGKSSFINSLTNRKNLAKSSQTPGKTRLINFFDIEFACKDERMFARLVDLPGFGYAKVSKSEKKAWQQSLTEFIAKRSSIRLFIHLIDARHPKMAIDQDVREYLKSIRRGDQVILEIFTKVDKLKQKDLSKLKREFPEAIVVSNLKKVGVQNATNKVFEQLFFKKCD
jgi:GTP-binding protein